MSMFIESETDCLDNLNDDELWNMLDDFASQNHITTNNIQTTQQSNTENNNDNDKDEEKKQVCKLCNSSNILFDSNNAVYICEDCGCEITGIFECKPEWTNFEDNTHETSRCGVATNYFFPKSSTSTILSGQGFYKLKMLQLWDQIPYKERSLSEVLNTMERKLKKYKITKSIIDNAKILYKNLSEIKHIDGINKGKPIIIRGYNRRGLIAACAFYGAKLQESPRSTKEIADIFDLEEKQVTKGCRRFLELLNYEAIYKFYASKAGDYIKINAYKLNLLKPHIELALKITNNIHKLDIASDHQPTSVAAGSILLVSDLKNIKLQKSKISEIFQISEVTIMKTYKKILPFTKFLINDVLTDMMVSKMKEKIKQNPDIVINNTISNIFLMPDETSSGTISESTSLTSNNSSEIQIINNEVSTMFNSGVSIIPKKKRGRPKLNNNNNI